jgi:hypothetical protein
MCTLPQCPLPLIDSVQDSEVDVGSLYLGQIYKRKLSFSPFTVDQKLQARKISFSYSYKNRRRLVI